MVYLRIICFALFAVGLLPVASYAQTSRNMTIDELFGLVESGNRSLRQQKTEVEVATHAVEEAKSRRLPDIAASLSVSYNGNVLMTDRDFANATGFSQPHIGNSFALEASQTVYAGGAINAGVRLAELQRRQACAAVEQTRDAQRFMALGMFLDLYKADNSIKVYESNILLTERLIEDVRARLSQGMTLKNDVTRYELQLETLRLGLRKVNDSRSVLNHQLCNALGLSGDNTIIPDSSVAALVFAHGSEAEWQSRALASSPALSLAELGVKTAGQQLKLARSGMFPEVAVIAADNFSGPFTYDIPPIDKNFNIWYVGVGVRYSLSSLFKSNKSVRRAKAAVRQSADSYAVATESLDNNVQEAYTLYMQSYADLRTQQKSVQLASENYAVVSDRYINQLALVTDMIDASNVKLDAELREADARVNIVYAYYKMKYLAGEI